MAYEQQPTDAELLAVPIRHALRFPDPTWERYVALKNAKWCAEHPLGTEAEELNF